MGVAILILDRADSKVRKVIRGRAGHYVMISKSILHEDIKILNVYVPNNRASI